MSGKRQYRRASRSPIVIGVALVLLVGLALIPVTSTLAAVPARHTVSISASHRGELRFGDDVRLRGLVTSNGTATPHVSVSLQAKKFPYKKPFHTVGSATTKANGHYVFHQSPSHNTQYHVVVTAHPRQRSSRVTVHVEVRFSTCSFKGHPTRIRVSCLMRYPSNVREQGRNAYWYLGLNHARRARHVDTTRIPAPSKPGLIHLVHVYHVQPGWTFANFWVFVRDLPDQGLGFHTCLDPFGTWTGGNSCAPPASMNSKTGKP